MKFEGFAIRNEEGFYVGIYLTEEDAILAHCPDTGKSWDVCKKRGDRVVRVRMKEISSKVQ
jgi:DNA-binding sugar fermentation-stimulating protein